MQFRFSVAGSHVPWMISARLRVSHASASIDASNVTGAFRMTPDGSV